MSPPNETAGARDAGREPNHTTRQDDVTGARGMLQGFIPDFARGLDAGDHRAPCPACNRGPNDDALSITVEPDGGGVWTCHRCHDAGNWPAPRNGARRPVARAVERPAPDFAARYERAAPAAASHGYLVSKRVQPHPGVRVEGDALLLPMRDASGAIVGLQTIAPNGAKRYVRGSRKVGARFTIGRPAPDAPILVCEGVATGASLHEATGHAVAVAFDAANLLHVARALRVKYPEARIVICADNDAATEGNPGRTHAEAAARDVRGLLAVPPEPGDFNDLCAARGADAVRAAVEAASAAAAPALEARLDEPARVVEGERLPWPLPGMTTKADGEPHQNEANLAVLLRAHAREFPFHFDIFRSAIIAPDGAPWSDEWDTRARIWCQHRRMPNAKGFAVRDAVRLVALERARDSLREYVETLQWDGVERIGSAFVEAWGAADSEFMRAASTNFFVALAARALRPGAQVDNLWVFEGAQGLGKSRALRTLGRELHGELSATLGSADAARQSQGKWIVELAEMRSLGGVAVETLRDVLTRQSDSWVPKYREHAREVPRRFVFVATTNAGTYWSDVEGARRLVPIKCGSIRLDLIEVNREHWFAEGVWRFLNNETWHVFPGAEVERADRQATSAWDQRIGEWLVGRTEVTIRDVLHHAIGFADHQIDARAENSAALSLRRLGWQATAQRRLPGGGRARMWERTGDE